MTRKPFLIFPDFSSFPWPERTLAVVTYIKGFFIPCNVKSTQSEEMATQVTVSPDTGHTSEFELRNANINKRKQTHQLSWRALYPSQSAKSTFAVLFSSSVSVPVPKTSIPTLENWTIQAGQFLCYCVQSVASGKKTLGENDGGTYAAIIIESTLYKRKKSSTLSQTHPHALTHSNTSKCFLTSIMMTQYYHGMFWRAQKYPIQLRWQGGGSAYEHRKCWHNDMLDR